jgi:hypothetical protein
MLLAPDNAGEDVTDHQKKRNAIEYLEQLFYTLNYEICRETKHKDNRAHVGEIHTDMPDEPATATFEMIGAPNQFSILYHA